MKLLQLAIKADKFTYGLLYPAFFGNMIYDLILAKTDHHYFVQRDQFAAGILIVVFYAIDFIHIYGDMDKSIGGHVENKSWMYIMCDFCTSSLFFTAFVFLKYQQINYSIVAIGIVPFIIALCKLKHSLNDFDKYFFLSYGIAFVLLTLAYLFLIPKLEGYYFLIFLILELSIYTWYVLIYFGKALNGVLEKNELR